MHSRRESSVINIRNFHNWTKRELLNKSCHYMNINYNMQVNSLLDLAVGSGCDMKKWYDNNIMYAIGFDICKESINEAKRRYKSLINDLKKKDINYLPIYKFYVLDLSDNDIIRKIKKFVGRTKFDIVSCQFAIHYFFESSHILSNLINIVNVFLKFNGLFIGTAMNGNKIKQLFNDNNIIENNIFKIENKSENTTISSYNNKCSVMLGGEEINGYFKNGESNEYLVDINELIDVCYFYNLSFVNITEFDQWYFMYGNDIMNDSEKEFSFLNFSFVFVSQYKYNKLKS